MYRKSSVKIVSRHVANIVLGLSFAAGTVWAQSIPTIGGNIVVARDSTDSVGGFYLMDTHHPFTAGGTLNSWEIYAGNTSSVQLVIYRQSHGTFIEVGRSGVEMPVVGYNLFRNREIREAQCPSGRFRGRVLSGDLRLDLLLHGSPWRVHCLPPTNYDLSVALTSSTPATSTDFTGTCSYTYSLRAF